MSDAPDDGGTGLSDAALASGRDGVVIRRAEPTDLLAVLRVKNAAWRETYGHVLSPETFDRIDARLDEHVGFWREHLAAGTRVWLAQEATGDVVGMAAVAERREAEGDESQAFETALAGTGLRATDLPGTELTSLYVLARAHGTGIGARLLEAALDGDSAGGRVGGATARASGATPATLWVLFGNDRAVRFYEKHGFVVLGAPVPIGPAWGDAREQLMVRR